MYLSTNVGFSSLPVFLPTIIAEMGFTPIQAQGLSAPPYFLAFLAVVASTFIADRTAQRGLTITVLSLIGAVGYIMLATSHTVAVRYSSLSQCWDAALRKIGGDMSHLYDRVLYDRAKML